MIVTAVAEIVTALSTAAIAIAAWRQLPLIWEQVSGLRDQLRQDRAARIAADERQRVWRSVDICERYDSDINLEAACARIWKDSEKGVDYKKCDSRDLVIVLNFLDAIAVGVEQDLYIESIVKDSLLTVIQKSVQLYLMSGLIEHENNEYRALVWLYDK